jgi:hypothetical protein
MYKRENLSLPVHVFYFIPHWAVCQVFWNVFVHKLLKTYSADAIRLLLAGHHYRQAWEFAITDMEHAQRLTDQIAEAARGDVSLGTPSVDSLVCAWTKPPSSRGQLANVECFYNRIRRHSSLGSVSPVACEQLMG